MTLADRILSFYQSLTITSKLPEGVEVLNPYTNSDTFKFCTAFYHKYYEDNDPRILILGINPGRYGAGLTGIPFTDPVKLEMVCGISNNLTKKAELSADFIYQMIGAAGGPEIFFHKYYISSVSPLGFIKEGRNLNYYDLPELQQTLHDFFISTLNTQLQFGIFRDRCYCLGEGKNYEFLMKLNKQYSFFKEIIPLPHPRFIMQYRRKKISDYIALYSKHFI
jgi:hypothetical protein